MKKTILGNILYLLNILWKIDRSTFWSIQLHILLDAIVPFISVLIPSVIIDLLLKERSLSVSVFVLGGLLLLHGILQGLVGYLNEYNAFAFIKSHGLHFVHNVYLGRTHLDYALLENEEYKKILKDAVGVVGTDNNGQEGMFHDFIVFAASLLGLILYAFASSGLSILFVLGLLLFAVLQYALSPIARYYEYSHRPKLGGYPIETRYLNQIAYDTAAGEDIRLYQLQGWINDKSEHVNRLIARIRTGDYSAYMLVDTLGVLLDSVRDIVCYAFSIDQLIAGMTIDEFVFYLGTISGSSLWFREVKESYARMSVNNVLINRMRTALQMKSRMHHGNGVKLDQKEIAITLDHVPFSYLNQDGSILGNISFTLHAGQRLVLVDANGAGKGTIVELILSFYTPNAGSICINGTNIHGLDLSDLYAHVTGIFQDAVMPNYFTTENVGIQDIINTDLQRIEDHLKRCGLRNFISTFPQQELTHIGKDIERGRIQPSGSQKQKLFIVRALYRGFGCLLLDEPTAASNALAERALYESYYELAQGTSSLFISHRLSSTRSYDEILVLDQRHVVEQGSHEELLGKQGAYAAMLQAQSQYYEEEGDGCECMAGN